MAFAPVRAMSEKSAEQSQDTTAKLHRMVGEFRTAMLVTNPGDGAPRARPMTIASADEQTLWFVTSKEAELTDELEADSGCAVTMQDTRTYVTLRGTAALVDDTERVRELWSESMRLWFPEGKASPRITLVQFSPISGEYWDLTGMQLVKFLFKALKAFGNSEQIEHGDPAEHARVQL